MLLGGITQYKTDSSNQKTIMAQRAAKKNERNKRIEAKRDLYNEYKKSQMENNKEQTIEDKPIAKKSSRGAIVISEIQLLISNQNLNINNLINVMNDNNMDTNDKNIEKIIDILKDKNIINSSMYGELVKDNEIRIENNNIEDISMLFEH